MNIQAVLGCLSALTFKKLGREGISIIDYTLARSLFNFINIICLCKYWKIDPLREFPKN